MDKKKKTIRIGAIILIVLAIISIGVGGTLFTLSLFKDNNKEEEIVNKDDKDQTVDEEKENYETSATFVAVGDALIHGAVYKDAYSNGVYDFNNMFTEVKPVFEQYDLRYYNQETILGGKDLGYSNYPRFNSPQEVGDAFVDAGFNLVSLATNHTMDKGERGVLNSVNYWKSKKI